MASLPYLLDQATQTQSIKKWISEGYIVLSNRYVTSSMGHQTAKFLYKKELTDNLQTEIQNFKLNTEAKNYLKWLQKAAYEEIGLLKEDLIILLYADPKITLELSRQAKERKTYTSGKDIAEDNRNHQVLSAYTFKYVAKSTESWQLLDCMKNGKLDSIGNIHQKIVRIIKSII